MKQIPAKEVCLVVGAGDGVGAGLIHDVPTVKDLIERIVAEVEHWFPRACNPQCGPF